MLDEKELDKYIAISEETSEYLGSTEAEEMVRFREEVVAFMQANNIKELHVGENVFELK